MNKKYIVLLCGVAVLALIAGIALSGGFSCGKDIPAYKIYSYDGDRLIGRIREENGQREEKICVYDNLGNPTKYLVTKGTVSNNVRWSETRQLSYYGGTSFSYDVRGKRLQKGTKNYSYDSEGRLLKQGEELEFLYDDKGVEIFNFGKYKGMSVAEVLKRDPGYYGWILNSDFTLNTKAMLTKIRLRELTQK